MSDDLEEQVLSWLAKTGYPLELGIGRRFQDSGWSVGYSRWYRDRETSKPRELDIEATVTSFSPRANPGEQRTRRSAAQLSLCVECKSSRNKPWIALSSGGALGDYALEAFAPGEMTRMAAVAARSEHIELPAILPPETPRVGGIVQALTDADKESNAPTSPYSAVRQARSAAAARDAEAYNTAFLSDGVDIVETIIPLVVFEGVLFQFAVDSTSKGSLHRVEAVVVTLPDEGADDVVAVPVVTRSFAEKLASSLRPTAKAFCDALLLHSSTTVAALRVRTPPESRSP